MAQYAVFIFLIVAFLLCFSIKAESEDDEENCETADCTLSRNATLKIGTWVVTQEISAEASSSLEFKLGLDNCRSSLRDLQVKCSLSVLILTPGQYSKFNHSKGDISVIRDQLDEDVTYFRNIKEDISQTVYFGQEHNVVLVFFFPHNDQSSAQYVDYSYEIFYYLPSDCAGPLAGFVFSIVGLIFALLIFQVSYKIYLQKFPSVGSNPGESLVTDDDIRASLDNDDISLTPTEDKEKIYHMEKQLMEIKNNQPWIFRPALSAQFRKPILPLFHRPKYDFKRFWIYTHHWLSFCFPGPDSKISRFYKMYLILTILMIRFFILIVINESMQSSSVVISHSRGSTIWSMIGRYIGPTFLAYLIEFVIGILYERLIIYKKNRDERNRTSMDMEDLDPSGQTKIGTKIKNIFNEYYLEIVLGLITFCVVIATFVLMTEITCDLFWKFVLGIFVIEFYKSVFPGFVMVWVVYLVLNTWGKLAVVDNPWNSEDEEVDDEQFRIEGEGLLNEDVDHIN